MINQVTMIKLIDATKARSCWDKGVKEYAKEIVLAVEDWDTLPTLSKEDLLLGAKDWEQYSNGGCSLVADEDIAKRLCTASDFKKYARGSKAPHGKRWIDIQAVALHQAYMLIEHILRKEA